jgi:hypothetical protein
MDDSLQIHCTRCRSTFRDRARRVVPGYSRQCPSCEVIIFFEEHSGDKKVTRALLSARRMRRILSEQEGPQPAARPTTVYDRTS